MLKHFFSILLVFAAITVCSQTILNRPDDLTGKRIAVIGDSYVRNHKDPIEYTWHYKFAQKYNMQYHNFGKNGNCIAFTRGGKDKTKAMYLRYAYMPDTLDYILVIGGHNDSYILDSIGGINGFKDKMHILCKGLLDKYPTAKIFFFTRWTCEDFGGSSAESVVDAMLEVCQLYSIPIFDAARRSGIAANNEIFRQHFFHRKTDNAHLNAKGHDRFLPVAESFILKY